MIGSASVTGQWRYLGPGLTAFAMPLLRRRLISSKHSASSARSPVSPTHGDHLARVPQADPYPREEPGMGRPVRLKVE